MPPDPDMGEEVDGPRGKYTVPNDQAQTCSDGTFRWQSTIMAPSELSLADVSGGCGLAIALYGPLDAGISLGEVLGIHRRTDCKPRIERKKPRFGNRG